MRSIFILITATLWGATPLLAQETSSEARVRTALERAERGGVPLELLESKLAEGKAKGVPLERIAAAMEKRSEALIRAHSVLTNAAPKGASSMDLSVTADALQQGVPEDVVRAVAEQSTGETRAVAINTLSRLVGEGVAPAEALDRVRRALEKGGAALLNLPEQAKAASRGRPQTPGSQAGTRPGKPGTAGPPTALPSPKGPPTGVPGGKPSGETPGGKPSGETPGGKPGGKGKPGGGPGGG